jgi:hypothetical protein
MAHTRKVFEDFNRRSKIATNVIAPTKKSVTIPTDLSDSDNVKILPSILNYSLNKVFPKTPCKKDCKKECCEKHNYFITQKDIGRHGIIIKSPGHYKFCSNIVYKPCCRKSPAIIIACSNVILDLDKFSLTQICGKTNVYGIVVARDVKYVTITGIKNIATIRNFTLSGIRVYGRTQYITIENVIVKQDIPKQLTPEEMPVDVADILTLSLNLGIAIGEGDTFGVHMQGTNKLNLVEELSFKDVMVDGSTIGCHMIFTYGFEVLRSVFTKNTYYGLLNGTGWVVPGDGQFGLEFPVGGNGVITDCRFEKNHGLNYDLANPADLYVFDFVSGVANYDVSNVTIDRCIVEDNSNNGYIIAADHDGARNIKWTNSIITATRSIYEPSDGLHFSGSIPYTIGSETGDNYPLIQNFNITVKNCTATDCKSDESNAVGIVFAYVQGCHISDSNSSGMVGGNQCAGFYVTGGLPGGRSSDITLVNNTAERNGTDGFGKACGFYIRNVSNDIVLKDNIANGNGTGHDLTFGAGFIIEATNTSSDAYIKNIDIDNCTAEGNGNGTENSGGIVILNLITDQTPAIENVAVEKSVSKFNNGYGVLLNGNIVGGSVNETEIYQNTLGGVNIINNTDSESVFVSRNIAYKNNSNNYNGVAAGNIVTGTASSLPSSPGFLNVSIN